jgi:hypothetical protein
MARLQASVRHVGVTIPCIDMAKLVKNLSSHGGQQDYLSWDVDVITAGAEKPAIFSTLNIDVMRSFETYLRT